MVRDVVDLDVAWFFIKHSAVEEAVIQEVLRILTSAITVVIGLDLEL